MSVHSCNSSDDWSAMTNCKVRVDGAWKQCKSIHANVDGEWKKMWSALEEQKAFTDPFYPYFASTGNQHTTGIAFNQPSIFQDLVIRKYTSASSEGELFPSGTGFRLDQKGQGSGYAIFYLDDTGAVSSITNNSGWTISAYASDSAVLTALDGGAYWWNGTSAVSSVTLTIN